MSTSSRTKEVLTNQMPWKMQSILSNGLRAPDVKTTWVKKAVRWMRTQICHNADPHKPDCYMTASAPTAESVVETVKELEYLTCHYVHHFADAARVLAIYHPDEATRHWAEQMHYYVAEEIFHFVPESKSQFIDRHRDKVDHA